MASVIISPSTGHNVSALQGSWQPSTRYYGSEPLPTKLSVLAPRKARILSREENEGRPLYQLMIADTKISDVGLEEILEYVSALDLEAFENERFAEEREILKIASAEEKREREARQLRQADQRKEMARMKGVVRFESVSETEEDAQELQHRGGVAERRGRPRPSYTHLYKKFRERKRRRKRDPHTGELLEFNDDGGLNFSDHEDELSATSSSHEVNAQPAELPRRRRRKRDKLTGELLPLSPSKNAKSSADEDELDQILQPKEALSHEFETVKHRRRKRDKVTGELLPLSPLHKKKNDAEPTRRPESHLNTSEHSSSAWLQNSNNEAYMSDVLQSGRESPSFKQLSISDVRQAKRQRLDVDRFLSPTDQHSAVMVDKGTKYNVSDIENAKDILDSGPVVDLTMSDEGSDNWTQSTNINPPTLLSESGTAKPRTELRLPQSGNVLTGMVTSHRTEPSPMDTTENGLDPSQPSTDEISESSGPDEYEIEEILSHSMSNPKSHPPGMGDQSIMLYRVKWLGFNEPTWEPVESFGDRRIVDLYRQKHNLTPLGKDIVGRDEREDRENVETSLVPQSVQQFKPLSTPLKERYPRTSLTSPSAPVEEGDLRLDEDDELSEGEYEIEEITAHHMSDPRTHPVEFGREPVMLYQVRWKGYPETTWEPEASFEDPVILQEYRRKAGIM